MESNKFYSNCLIEAIRAKIKNPKIRLMYMPAFLNEVPCFHIMWMDGDYEYDFWHNGPLKWYQWFWHTGIIRRKRLGYYRRCMNAMIKFKYYRGRKTY